MAKYYVGDLCYVINDRDAWEVQLKHASLVDWEGVYGGKLPKGGIYMSCFTKYGDGCYRGSDGYEYGVDSGTIGVIKCSIAKRYMSSKERGDFYCNIVEFKCFPDIKYDKGIITITDGEGTTITIDTDDEDDDETDEAGLFWDEYADDDDDEEYEDY